MITYRRWLWLLALLALVGIGTGLHTIPHRGPEARALLSTWTPFTPTWGSFKSPQPTLGNGTVTGSYTQTGTVWTIQWKMTFGSTTRYSTAPGINIHYLSFPPGFSSTVEQTAPAVYGEIFGVQFRGSAWFHPDDVPLRLYVTWPGQNAANPNLSYLWGTGTGVAISPAPPHPQEDFIVTATFLSS